MRKPLTIIFIVGAFAVAVKNLFTGEGALPPEDPGHRRDTAGWKPWLWTTAKYFAAFSALLAVGGFLLTASGIIPIKASSGHWGITRWFLNFASQRSVSTQTIGMDAPPLDDARFVLKGAGAYESNCRACHGSPSLPSPRVAQHMTPRPPYLPSTLHEWDDPELFYIVKHGIKFTGMPSWPAEQRDDEVWAMVAFLRQLPQLDAAQYRHLALGEADLSNGVAPLKDLLGPTETPNAIAASCARCHGADGLGRGAGAFPKLAGQRALYFYNSMLAYALRERHSGVMGPIVQGLSDEEMRELARYYSALESAPPFVPNSADAEGIERGRRIAVEGITAQRIPSCVSCHGPGVLPRNPAFPELGGQYSEYLALQLRLFKQNARGGTGYANIMRSIAERLAEEQIRDVALYYSSLSPAKHGR